ncbi:hypothetical protein ACLOJK_016426 [Asimina triloba]
MNRQLEHRRKRLEEMKEKKAKRSHSLFGTEDFDRDLTADILSCLPLKTLAISMRLQILPGNRSGFLVFGVFWARDDDSGYKIAFIRNLNEDITNGYANAGFFLSGACHGYPATWLL